MIKLTNNPNSEYFLVSLCTYVIFFILLIFQTIFTIDEINNMLKCVQDAVGYDVHCISPEAQAMLKSIEVSRLNNVVFFTSLSPSNLTYLALSRCDSSEI